MELYLNKYNMQKSEEKTPEEIIKATWEAEFGNRIPSVNEKLKFYRNLRNAGFNGLLIFEALDDKI